MFQQLKAVLTCDARILQNRQRVSYKMLHILCVKFMSLPYLKIIGPNIHMMDAIMDVLIRFSSLILLNKMWSLTDELILTKEHVSIWEY